MKLDVNGVSYHIEELTTFDLTRPTLICLHGFTGTAKTFSFLQEASLNHNIIAIDVIGHGRTSVYVHPYRYTAESQIKDLAYITSQLGIETFDLLGYSMGGRLALSYALTYPKKINHLILESSSPGLEESEERQKRQISDRRLACRLIEEGIVTFVDFWQNIPLFATQKKMPLEKQQSVRQERLSQKTFGLAMSLLYFGTGVQPSLWQSINEDRPFQTSILVGELDGKFVSLAKEMTQRMSNSHMIVFEKSGHCIHLEQPGEFVEVIEDILKGEKN